MDVRPKDRPRGIKMARPKVKYGIKEIAVECGVSPATVSRVFNEHPNVRDSIREKVFLAAEKFNYKPEQKSIGKVIGIIIPDLCRQPFGIYHNTIIPPLIEEIHRRGYGSMLVPMDDLKLVKRYFIFGCIAIAFDDEIIRDWDNHFHFPLVVINSPGKVLYNASSVKSNEEQGMFLAVKHLVDNGHREIGLLIDGNLEMNASKRDRHKGFQKAMRRMNCPPEKSLIQMSGEDNMMEAVGRLIRNGATGIICCGEISGFQVDYIMNLFAKKVPEEISIIAFENSVISEFCTPPHTTICQDFETLANEAVGMLDQTIRTNSHARDILVDYKLIQRESVRKIGNS